MAGVAAAAPDLNNKLNDEFLSRLRDAKGTPAVAADTGERPVRMLERAPGVEIGFEAIVIADVFKRPALLVRNNTFEQPQSNNWRSILDPQRSKLEAGIRSVGRLELRNHPSLPYAGTAWMIAEDIAITNRHVASIFARKQGTSFPFVSGPLGKLEARIDFREEHNILTTSEVVIDKVLFISDPGDSNADVALVKIAKGRRLPDPILLFDGKVKAGQLVAAIGYPANDPRNPASAVSGIFGSVFEVKRFSPGQVTGNPRGFVFTHDCSTLGGNSGSVVIDIETGRAIGLHFAGSFRENNFGVEAEELKKILKKLKIQVSVPAAFIEKPKKKKPSEAQAPDLSGRKGYDDKFLGSTAALRLAIPKIKTSVKDEVAKVKGTTDNVLRYTHFSIVMNATRRLLFFTACNIDGSTSTNIRRSEDKWFLDPRIDVSQQAGNELYANNDLDRGHMVRRLDPVWGASSEAKQANNDTFFYTNATPQHARLNQGNWNDLEDYILTNTNAKNLKVNVFTGPVFASGDPQYRAISIPQRFWKVVAVVNGDTGKLHATAYMLSQSDLLSNIEFVFGQFRTYQVPIAEVERQAMLDFGDKVRNADPLRKQEAFAIREVVNLDDIVL